MLALVGCLLLPGPAAAVEVLGVDDDGQVVRFDTATPGTIDSSVTITGLQIAETVLGIDFNQVDGEIYAVGSTSRLYTIDSSTGVATQVGGGPFAPLLVGDHFGVDANAAGDYIRVVSDADQTLRLDPATGLVTTDDSPLAFEADDPNELANPNVVGAAEAPGFGQPLLGIDSSLNAVVHVHNADEPEDNELRTLLPALPVDTDEDVGFEISPGGNPLAVLESAPGTSRLYLLNPFGETVTATLLGTVGEFITGGIAVPFDEPVFDATPDPMTFGSQSTGTIGPARDLNLEVVGGDGALISDITVEGPHRDDFFVTTNECGNRGEEPLNLLDPDCSLRLRFAPGGTGARSATLKVHKPACCPSEYFSGVPLTGTGTAAPVGAQGPPGPSGADRNLLAAAFALDRYRARPRRKVALRYVATVAARVAVEVRRGPRVVARKRTRARKGRNRTTIRAPRRPGRYKLVLRAVAGRQTATDSARLTVAR
jgi:hypothetical protein